ncbi:DUF397 domain-containing protein [Saccharopolyspora sp. ASAGF58]|uniref:DUF397 domain-containing protein n=1 Tax=Saccharopolyspora sp. ASAGF58 TaxID=2719023 RepID=UPI00143FE290|nr:DUF397 domain-containing protein [Saccharopolyspora sp. ASAGF58]QIZ35801.1 DUF397 domain-containing protein [Saccharopolyspora sp. ASAGF58]
MKFEFRKSSYSGGGSGTCVEVASNVPGVWAIRDSKNSTGEFLLMEPGRLIAFVEAVKSGRFDH